MRVAILVNENCKAVKSLFAVHISFHAWIALAFSTEGTTGPILTLGFVSISFVTRQAPPAGGVETSKAGRIAH